MLKLGLDVDGAMVAQVQVGVPGHLVDGAVEEGVGVVEEAGVAGVFDGGEPPPAPRPFAAAGLARRPA